MNNNLNHFKNYNIITGCEFLDSDQFSKKLVEIYKKAVERANGKEELVKVSKFDFIMRKYIEDYTFSKKLRNSIDVSSFINSQVDLTEDVLNYTIDFNDHYNEDVDTPIVNTRWI